jgi:hypothetical protein
VTTKNYPDMPLYSGQCYCTVCGLMFKSEAAFDKHRPGREFPITCLTPDQMRAKGMGVNDKGQWVTQLNDRLDRYGRS